MRGIYFYFVLFLFLGVTGCQVPDPNQLAEQQQQEEYIVIGGRVADEIDEPVANAQISTSLDSSIAQTDSQGHYRLLTSIITDEYDRQTPFTIRVHAEGFDPYAVTKVWEMSGRSSIDAQITLVSENARPQQILVEGVSQTPSALKSPNGGEHWVSGQRESIIWDASQIAGSAVNLYILFDAPIHNNLSPKLINSKNWYQFATSVPNTGRYDLDPAVINGSGNAYMVLVVSADDRSQYDMSDQTFSLNYNGD